MINFKLRLQNKTTLITMVLAAISFIYMILEVVGIIPKFDQDTIIKIALGLIDLLALVGIVIDPTTAGVSDSARAMSYMSPYKPGDNINVADGTNTVFIATPGTADIKNEENVEQESDIK